MKGMPSSARANRFLASPGRRDRHRAFRGPWRPRPGGFGGKDHLYRQPGAADGDRRAARRPFPDRSDGQAAIFSSPAARRAREMMSGCRACRDRTPAGSRRAQKLCHRSAGARRGRGAGARRLSGALASRPRSSLSLPICRRGSRSPSRHRAAPGPRPSPNSPSSGARPCSCRFRMRSIRIRPPMRGNSRRPGPRDCCRAERIFAAMAGDCLERSAGRSGRLSRAAPPRRSGRSIAGRRRTARRSRAQRSPCTARTEISMKLPRRTRPHSFRRHRRHRHVRHCRGSAQPRLCGARLGRDRKRQCPAAARQGRARPYRP